MNSTADPAPLSSARTWRTLRLLGLPVMLVLRIAATLLWVAIGLWTSLAVYFAAPLPMWAAGGLGLAIFALFVAGMLERVPRNAPAGSWRGCRVKLAALGVAGLVAVLFFSLTHPDPDWDWTPEQAHQPRTTFDGETARVEFVRNFAWRSRTDFTPAWETRTFDLSKLESMAYVVVPLGSFEGAAHVFVCFGFADGAFVAVSVEGRRRTGDAYRVVPSMFREYQIIYLVGDERDIVGLRGKVWGQPVRFYPARISPERARAVFRSMLERANALRERPEFYHLVLNNCLTNITRHLREIDTPLPHDLALVMTGLSDRVAYRLGYIQTDLPWERAREAFRIDGWMRTAELDEGFSRRLREELARREAEGKMAEKAAD